MFYVCEMLSMEGDVYVRGEYATETEAKNAGEYLHQAKAMNVEIVSCLGDEAEETIAMYIH